VINGKLNLSSILVTLCLLTSCSSEMYLLIKKPDDLRNLIVYEKIDLSKSGSKYSTQYTNKYPGKHAVGITMHKAPPIYPSPDIKLILKITISDEDKVLLSKESIPNATYLRSACDCEPVNKAFINYEVSEEIPLGKELTLNIEVIKGDPGIIKQFGATHYFIQNITIW